MRRHVVRDTNVIPSGLLVKVSRVSQLVADRANIFGKFISVCGEFPGYILIYFAVLFVIIASSSVIERFSYFPLLALLVLMLFVDLLEYFTAVIFLGHIFYLTFIYQR